MWNDVTYDAGELKAVAYKEGVKIGEALMVHCRQAIRYPTFTRQNTIHAD
jgi:hypothetical protein